MDMMSAAQAAERWGVTDRMVRLYCAQGKIPGVQRAGRAWLIPVDAERPGELPKRDKCPTSLLDVLRREKEAGLSGGLYHRLQIDFTYNSNHMEGSRLTHDQTRYIFETNTIGVTDAVRVDDIVETANHFRCIDLVIDTALRKLRPFLIKQLHLQLKTGTSDAAKSWFAVGGYKRLPNEVGGRMTARPEEVADHVDSLIARYENGRAKTLEEIVAFHAEFEAIHPFQDGNGRVGRLLMLKECLRHGVVPFVIGEDLKMFYYRGLSEWSREPGYLLDTCRAAQDEFRLVLERFGLHELERIEE